MRSLATYRIRPMVEADLDDVIQIDRLAFPTPTKRSLFQFELSENEMACYYVLEEATIIGFSGFWRIGDEVHISTIATHPAWRGQGLGELLLLNMLDACYELPVTMVTLEVRRSNQVAQALYQKYQFVPVGERPRYYRDTNEDAIIMTLAALDAPYRLFLQERERLLRQRLAEQ